MNISKLKKNQEFKNYREMCNILGMKVAGGKSKILQLKELERFCEYHKEGNKIIIDVVYRRARPKVDKRTHGNNNAKAKATRYLLLNFLSNFNLRDDQVISFSKARLLKQVNIINDNYIILKNDKKKYAKDLGVPLMAINECLEYFDDRSMKLINRSLKTLVDNKVLAYKYSYTWVDEDGNHMPCSVEEHNAIMDVEFETLRDLDCKDKYFALRSGKFCEFKEIVTERIKKEYPVYFKGLKKYYLSYNFHFVTNNLLKYKKEIENKFNLDKQSCLNSLEELWVESVTKTINARAEKAKTLKRTSNITEYRMSDNYVKEQLYIVKSLTDMDFMNLSPDANFEQMRITLEDVEIPF